MSEFFLFVLASIGLTHIMVASTIMLPLRVRLKEALPSCIYEVFECYQCMGTWCGAICGAMVLINHWVFDLLLYACAGSIVANLFIVLMDFIECKTEYNLPPGED